MAAILYDRSVESSVESPRIGAWWSVAAHVFAVVVALGIGYFISKSPLQINDCLDNLIEVQRKGIWELLESQFTSKAFLRPLLWAQLDLSFNLADGHYHQTYKAIHTLQLVSAALLFVNLLRVNSMAGALAVPFGVALLFGAHTFGGTVVEGFPINTFLTIVVCCLIAANLSFGRPARWRDVAAVGLFVFAAFTVESGLLVWVIFAAAWFAGCRGVSRRALVATTAAMLAYFYLRFGPLNVGVPSLVDRSSGFGFRILDPPELIAKFGDRPWVFYAYNVLCQVLTVLFAEPKGGVWVATRALLDGELLPRHVIGIASSTGATLLIVSHVFSRLRDWRRGFFEHGDRLLLVFVAVLGANAAISYSYTKDVIVSPAGVFYAVAGSVAFAHALARLGRPQPVRLPAVALTFALALLSAGWSVRLVAIHYQLHEKAFIVRNDWMWMGREPNDPDLKDNPEGTALARQLYDEAVRMRVPGTYFYPAHVWRYFEVPW